MRLARFRMAAAAALLAAAAIYLSPPAAAGEEDSPGRSGKPRLILQAAPRHGFQPLDVTLYGRLENVPEGEEKFCHAGLEWIGEKRSGRVMRSTEDARCIHPDEVKRVDHSYSKSVHVSRPGVYRYHLILHLKDGSLVRSNLVEVRVLASR